MLSRLLALVCLLGVFSSGLAQSPETRAVFGPATTLDLGQTGMALSPITITAAGSLMVFFGTAERMEIPFPVDVTLSVTKNGGPWVVDSFLSRYGPPQSFAPTNCGGATISYFYASPGATVNFGPVEAGDQIDFVLRETYSGVPVQVGGDQVWNANLGLDCVGSSSWWERLTISIAVQETGGVDPNALVDVTLLLEGPYDAVGDSMAPTLNTLGYLESSARLNPYLVPPWNYPVQDSVAVGFFAAHPDVVDWVYLELRTGDPDSPPMVIEDRQVGLLTTEGHVRSHIDGMTPVMFDSTTTGDRYVVACHRNHLCVMSDTTIEVGGGASFSFASAEDQSYGTGPVKQVASSPDRFALYSGDGDADGQVTATDFNGWLVQTKSVLTGYTPFDFGMDGGVTALDFNLWLVNTKAVVSSQVP
jgi:hypothetical protein